MILKRKLRLLPIIVAIIFAVIYTCKSIVHFQLNKEIKYYNKYFRQRKDGIQGSYNPLAIKQLPSETIDHLYDTRLARAKSSQNKIQWSKLAYVNYVTDASYLCNTLIMFNTLIKKGTHAKLVLLISQELLDPSSDKNKEFKTVELINYLEKMSPDEKDPQIIIKPVNSILKPNDSSQWKNSLTKLLVFNQTEYDRIIYMDNDAYLRDNLDELFFIPDYIKFAAPLTYWLLSEKEIKKSEEKIIEDDKEAINLSHHLKIIDNRIDKGQMIYNHLPSLPPSLFLNSDNVANDIIRATSGGSPLFDFSKIHKTSKLKFASNLMVIKPSTETFDKIMLELVPQVVDMKEKYDMDLINEYLYNLKHIITDQFMLFRRLKTAFIPEVMVLPFARYGLLSGSTKNKAQHSMIENDVLGYHKLGLDGNALPFELEKSVELAKYIHFSDAPLGKPWQYKNMDHIKCIVSKKSKNIKEDTSICNTWNSIYESYMLERNICAKV